MAWHSLITTFQHYCDTTSLLMSMAPVLQIVMDPTNSKSVATPDATGDMATSPSPSNSEDLSALSGPKRNPWDKAFSQRLEETRQSIATLSATETANVNNALENRRDAGWLEGANRILTGSDPYAHELALSETKRHFIDRAEHNIEIASQTTDRAQAVESLNRARVAAGLEKLDPATLQPVTDRSTGIGGHLVENESYRVDQENLITTRDTIAYTVPTLATLGMSAIPGAIKAAPAAISAGRAMLQGAVMGGFQGAADGPISATDDVLRGEKTPTEALGTVAVSATIGSATGGGAGVIGNKVGQAITKYRAGAEAVEELAEDALKVTPNPTPPTYRNLGPNEIGAEQFSAHVNVGGREVQLNPGETLQIGSSHTLQRESNGIYYLREEGGSTQYFLEDKTVQIAVDGKPVTLDFKGPNVAEVMSMPYFNVRSFETAEYKAWADDFAAKARFTPEHDALMQAGEQFQVFAHGVDEQKGGLRNLVGIASTGKVCAGDGGPGYFGPLTNKLSADTSAGSHGPYYVIENGGNPANYEYVVPNEEAKRYFQQGLEEVRSWGMITPAQVQDITSRTHTYESFINSRTGQAANDITRAAE